MINTDLPQQQGIDATGIPAAPIQPTTFNPGIKPSGASVSFSPKAQSTITNAFGNPTVNSYDRTVSGPTPIPNPIIDRNTPVSNFQNT